MRVNQITLQGITRYAEEVTLDLASLGPGLVAIAGPNGAGKTTLLEAPFAALQLEYPSRPGPLYSVCHGKDARIGLDLGGYRADVCVDAVLKTPKTEAYLTDGSPIVSGKVREYQAEIERRCGSRRLMMAAMLSAQSRRGGFLDLSKAERKELLSEILDTEGLQELAEAARARARAADSQIERLRGALDHAQNSLSQLADEPDSLEDLSTRRAQLEAEISQLAANLEEAREAYADLRRRQTESDARRTALQRMSEDIRLIERQIEQSTEEMRHATARLRQRREDLEREMAAAREEAGRLAEYEAAERQVAQLREELSSRREELQAAEEELERTQREHGEAARHNSSRQTQYDALTVRLETAGRAAGLLGDVPCTAEETWHGVDLAGACPLLADARTGEQRARELTAQIEALPAEIDLEPLRKTGEQAYAQAQLAKTTVRDTEAAIEEQQQVAAKAPAARAAEQTIQRAAADLSRAGDEHREQMERLREQRDELVARRDDLLAQRKSAPPFEDLGPQLAEAAQRGRDIRTQHDITTERLRELDRQIARAEAAAAQREELQATITETTGQLEALERDTAEWRVLERALGRDGIQALEIDAAGPELSELTTDLLRTCFGPRFEVRFVTQAPRKDGGMKEVFDCTVLDYERGREGDVGTLSGGEKTIVSEAISLALAIYVGHTSEHRFETLFRDETAGSLDPENAQRYVQMLRRARSLAGAHQIVYIAQQREVWEQADCVVWVEGGRVTVVEGAGEVAA